MGERPKGLGKVAENGTLNESGAFYSVQDINVLLENGGGSSGGGVLPTPTVADAGSVVVVDEEGKYSLGEAGGGDFLSVEVAGNPATSMTLNKSYKEISDVLTHGGLVSFIQRSLGDGITAWYLVDSSYDEAEAEPYTVLLFTNSGMGEVTLLLFVSATETGTLTYTP